VKLTLVVNFINILRTNFLYQSALCSFSLVTFGFKTKEKLLEEYAYKKLANKMLMKLTPGVNFTNILKEAFLYIRKCCALFFSLHFDFVFFGKRI